VAIAVASWAIALLLSLSQSLSLSLPQTPNAKRQADNNPGEDEYEDEYEDEGDSAAAAAVEPPPKPFPYRVVPDPQTAALASVPLALFWPLVAACAALAGLAGAALGRAAPLSREARDATAVAVGAAAAVAVAAAGVQAKKKRDGAAVIDLYNTLADMPDPAAGASAELVASVGRRHGLDLRRDQPDGLRKIYGQFLEATVPAGENPLRGDEAARILAFKDALGLSDEEAAPAHIEAGRRLSRAGSEARARLGQFEQRKAFQRLIYLSYLVFGEQKAAFLLPWRRVFNLTDAQVFVARRDNARALFAQRLAALSGGADAPLPADRAFLKQLRAYQQEIRVMDESADEVVRAAARRGVEKHVKAAIAATRAPGRARDPARAVAELRAALDYGRKLERLAAEDDDPVPGLGMPSLVGGDFDPATEAGAAKRRDVSDAYRLFLDQGAAAAGGAATDPDLERGARELAAVLGIPAKEAADARAEVAGTLYRALLKAEVSSRRIDAAPSPAAVLQDLCRRSGFAPEAALVLHRTLYRQKMAQLAAKRRLTDADEADLARIRRVLCVPAAVAAEVARATCGRLFEEAVSDIYLGGAKPLIDAEAARVEDVLRDLKLERQVALDAFAEVTRTRFKAYAGQAQKDLQRDKRAAAGQLKKLVQFNAVVVTPLLERIKAAGVSDGAKRELAEVLAQAAAAAKKEEEQEEAAKAAATKEAAAAAGAEEGDGGAAIDVAAEAPAGEADAEAAAAPAPAAGAAEEAERRDVSDRIFGTISSVSGPDKKAKAEAEAEAEAAAAAAAAAAAEAADGQNRRAQNEITLGASVDPAVRAELYKVFLMGAMGSEVVDLPVGGQIRKKAGGPSRQHEMARLQQLSDLLGMSQPEVMAVHADLSEQAFKAQAQDVLRGNGTLTPERRKYLDDMASQLGLAPAQRDKVVKEVRTEVLGVAAAMEDSATGERYTPERIMQLAKEGVDVQKMLEEPARRGLLRRELDRRLSDGRGDFDPAFLLGQLPAALGVDEMRVKGLLRELAGPSRGRTLLVQAVSHHRQRRPREVATCLLNFLSAARCKLPLAAAAAAAAAGAPPPAERKPVQWGEREELKELYAEFCGEVPDAVKRSELAALFGVTADEARELEQLGSGGGAAAAAGAGAGAAGAGAGLGGAAAAGAGAGLVGAGAGARSSGFDDDDVDAFF